ncbi:MAG: hypothetical protein ABSE46_20260 [Terracidiphilus sp.]
MQLVNFGMLLAPVVVSFLLLLGPLSNFLVGAVGFAFPPVVNHGLGLGGLGGLRWLGGNFGLGRGLAAGG